MIDKEKYSANHKALRLGTEVKIQSCFNLRTSNAKQQRLEVQSSIRAGSDIGPNGFCYHGGSWSEVNEADSTSSS
ncbi:MAG: hypothetical protein AAF614_32405 [Chloroflexota bacterium]